MEKNIFIFDQNKCVGCHACVIACMNENGFQSPDQWRNIHKSQEQHFPDLPLFYLSLACNHCDDAPCLKNCPSLAYSRDEKTGAVIHNPEKCIGCKYCTWACPYDAPKYNPKKGIIEKCTFCNHRIEENIKPACANLCPVGALDFVKTDFTRQESIKSSPVPVDVGSKLLVKKLRNTFGPEIDQNLFNKQNHKVIQSKKHTKISAKKEWPLIVFTILSSVLVSLFISKKAIFTTPVEKLIFLVFVALAATFSLLHLGKKYRAWRSIINFKSSWLSKEIVLFCLFFTAVFIDFYIFKIPVVYFYIIGVLLLISIDMLYYLATWQWPIKLHSAQTLFIGFSFYTIFSENILFFVFILSFRLTLYIYRKIQSQNKNYIVSLLRISLPIIAILINQDFLFLLILFSIGEITDRIEFYNELNLAHLQ